VLGTTIVSPDPDAVDDETAKVVDAIVVTVICGLETTGV
jgi:hypothetical protein